MLPRSFSLSFCIIWLFAAQIVAVVAFSFFWSRTFPTDSRARHVKASSLVVGWLLGIDASRRKFIRQRGKLVRIAIEISRLISNVTYWKKLEVELITFWGVFILGINLSYTKYYSSFGLHMLTWLFLEALYWFYLYSNPYHLPFYPWSNSILVVCLSIPSDYSYWI